MVMPRSRSISIESSIWSFISRSDSAAAQLDQPVGERRFAVVDMGDDGEIADMGGISHLRRCLALARSKVKADVRALIPR